MNSVSAKKFLSDMGALSREYWMEVILLLIAVSLVFATGITIF